MLCGASISAGARGDRISAAMMGQLDKFSKSSRIQSPEIRPEDVVKAKELEKREKRLTAKGKTKLYHRTNKQACENILKEGALKPGRVGRLGPAIYGTTSALSTRFKTVVTGSCCMVTFSALLGRVLTVPADTPYFKIGTVLKWGYDSAKMPGLGYAIYFRDQVTALAAYPCNEISGSKAGPYYGVVGNPAGLNLEADAPAAREMKPMTADKPVATSGKEVAKAVIIPDDDDYDAPPPWLQTPNKSEDTHIAETTTAAPERTPAPRASGPPRAPARPEAEAPRVSEAPRAARQPRQRPPAVTTPPRAARPSQAALPGGDGRRGRGGSQRATPAPAAPIAFLVQPPRKAQAKLVRPARASELPGVGVKVKSPSGKSRSVSSKTMKPPGANKKTARPPAYATSPPRRPQSQARAQARNPLPGRTSASVLMQSRIS